MKRVNKMTRAELLDALLAVDPVPKFLTAISWNTEYLEGDTSLGGLFRWTGSADLYGYMVRRVAEELNIKRRYRGRAVVDWERFAMYIENIPSGQQGKNPYPKGGDEIERAIARAKEAKKFWGY